MVLRAAPARMVSEYSPNLDGATDDAPYGLAGVVSFDAPDDDDDDGEGVVAAGEMVGVVADVDGDGGDVAGAR